VKYAETRWGTTLWRLTSSFTGHYNVAATNAADDEKSGPSARQAGGPPAGESGQALNGIR